MLLHALGLLAFALTSECSALHPPCPLENFFLSFRSQLDYLLLQEAFPDSSRHSWHPCLAPLCLVYTFIIIISLQSVPFLSTMTLVQQSVYIAQMFSKDYLL